MPLPCIRARLAQPIKRYIMKRFPTPCTGGLSITIGLAQGCLEPLDFVLFCLSHAFCPIFRAQSRPAPIFRLAQNLFPALDNGQKCARPLHSPFGIIQVCQSNTNVRDQLCRNSVQEVSDLVTKLGLLNSGCIFGVGRGLVQALHRDAHGVKFDCTNELTSDRLDS